MRFWIKALKPEKPELAELRILRMKPAGVCFRTTKAKKSDSEVRRGMLQNYKGK